MIASANRRRSARTGRATLGVLALCWPATMGAFGASGVDEPRAAAVQGATAQAPVSQAASDAAPPDPVRRVVDDYVGLYRKDTLAEWRRLFLPTFTSTSTNADGTVTVRALDQFYDAQARGFARATEMSEMLEHVVIERSGRLATAWADFVFRQDGTSRRGRLVLTLVEAEGAWKIANLMFSY